MKEMISNRNPKLNECIELTKQRLADMPAHDLFIYLEKQLSYIKLNLNENGKLSTKVFDTLNIGVLCAKELEHIDAEFCSAIYEMLEEVGPKIDWGFEI